MRGTQSAEVADFAEVSREKNRRVGAGSPRPKAVLIYISPYTLKIYLHITGYMLKFVNKN